MFLPHRSLSSFVFVRALSCHLLWEIACLHRVPYNACQADSLLRSSLLAAGAGMGLKSGQSTVSPPCIPSHGAKESCDLATASVLVLVSEERTLSSEDAKI